VCVETVMDTLYIVLISDFVFQSTSFAYDYNKGGIAVHYVSVRAVLVIRRQ